MAADVVIVDGRSGSAMTGLGLFVDDVGGVGLLACTVRDTVTAIIVDVAACVADFAAERHKLYLPIERFCLTEKLKSPFVSEDVDIEL